MPDTLCRRAPHALQWIAPSLPKAARSPRLPWRAGEKQQACGEGRVHTANPDMDCKLKGEGSLELRKRHRHAGMAQHSICTIWWLVCTCTVPALAHHRRALPLTSSFPPGFGGLAIKIWVSRDPPTNFNLQIHLYGRALEFRPTYANPMSQDLCQIYASRSTKSVLHRNVVFGVCLWWPGHKKKQSI